MDDPNTPPKTETIYDPAIHKTYKPDTRVAREAMTRKARSMSVRFFIFAALNLFEFLNQKSGHTAYAIFALLAGLMFLAIGIYAVKVHRNAFLAAAGIYALQILFYLIIVFTTEGGFFFFAIPLAIKCAIFWQIYVIYGQLVELHSLEEGDWA